MSNHFEILDIDPRTGVFDVRITNENGEEEVFTFDNDKMENKEYLERIKNTIKKRNSTAFNKSDIDEDVGKTIEIE